MTVYGLIIWSAAFIVTAALYALYRRLQRKLKPALRAVVFTAEILAVLSLSMLFMVFLPRTFIIIVCLIPLMWGSIAVTAAEAVLHKFLSKEKQDKFRKNAWIFSAAAAACIFIYGTVNMQLTSEKKYSIQSEKLDRPYRIAFVSDLHSGSAKLTACVEKACGRIKETEPDILIIGGDFADEFTTVSAAENYLSALSRIEAPLGKYFIYGNHEYLLTGNGDGKNLSPGELKELLNRFGFTVLNEDTVMINNDLVIAGRTDITGGERNVREFPDISSGEKFVVAADHQPVYWEENISRFGAGLQLSGHTHAAQVSGLFPFYAASIKYVYGRYDKDGYTLIISSGLAGWEYPFRTAEHCEYVIADLSPAQ